MKERRSLRRVYFVITLSGEVGACVLSNELGWTVVSTLAMNS